MVLTSSLSEYWAQYLHFSLNLYVTLLMLKINYLLSFSQIAFFVASVKSCVLTMNLIREVLEAF